MNVITGKKPLAELRNFNGLWARGSYMACPLDHLTDCYNCTFPSEGQVTIRERFTVQNIIGGGTVISFAVVTLSVGAALICLHSTGNLVDETHATLLGGPFIGADDFVALSIFGRAYISLKQKGRAYPGGSLYYYDGVSLKLAAGGGPITALTLAQVNPGNVDPGIHTLAVSYITATGFVTTFSPLATITSTGANDIEISNIPLGPVGTIGRVLFITRANENELFFIPGGQINDNITTTFVYNGFDTSLIASADYLNDILSTIPSVAALKFYRGRLILIGKDVTPDIILASNLGSSETFNRVNNTINLPVDYGINTSAGGMIIRSVLYVTKSNGTYSIQDNGNQPNTWAVDIVDSGLGAFDAGISNFASSMSAQDVLDSCLLTHKRGLLYFNGVYSDVPLTYKIQSIWDLIDSDQFWRVQIAHDIWNKRVYIAVPLDPQSFASGGPISRSGTGENNIILMMDYREGMTPKSVKWSVWTGIFPIKKITVENFTLNYTNATMIYQLALCNGGTTIYKLNPPILSEPQLPDDLGGGSSAAIKQLIVTAPISPGGTTIFSCLNFILNLGYGALNSGLYNRLRSAASINLRTFQLQSYSGIDLQRLINFTSEGMQVQIYCDQTNPNGNQGYFTLTGLDVYGTVMYSMRPALVETL